MIKKIIGICFLLAIAIAALFVLYSFVSVILAILYKSHGYFVLAFIGFFVGLYGFYYAFNRLKLKRNIEDIPTSKIHSLAIGQAEVKGAVKCRKELLSPFRGQECIYYKWKIEFSYRTAKGGKHWGTLKSGSAMEPFYIEDETGRAIVYPKGSEMKVELDKQTITGATEKVRRFAEKNNIRIAGKEIRCTESIWAPYDIDEVYILGTAHFWKKKAEKRRLKPGNQMEEGSRMLQQEDDKCFARIIKGDKKSYFIISDKSEDKIVSNLNIMLLVLFYGAPIFSAGCMIYMLYNWHGFYNYYFAVSLP